MVAHSGALQNGRDSKHTTRSELLVTNSKATRSAAHSHEQEPTAKKSARGSGDEETKLKQQRKLHLRMTALVKQRCPVKMMSVSTVIFVRLCYFRCMVLFPQLESQSYPSVVPVGCVALLFLSSAPCAQTLGWLFLLQARCCSSFTALCEAAVVQSSRAA